MLQKTIDFIHHLQNSIKKLQEENQRLREALAMGKKHSGLVISVSWCVLASRAAILVCWNTGVVAFQRFRSPIRIFCFSLAGKRHFNSPPNTPDAPMSESDVDSGNPSSPDESVSREDYHLIM